jgi:DNA-binding transcriptional LysR family regulator
MLNLARLNILREVVQRGSFSAAAQALDYTQSAVSQAIARLEAETGASLLVRDRRGVWPTAAGATLLVAAGVGVALIPRLALSHRQPGLVVRRLAPGNPVRQVFAATPREPGVVPAAQVMLRILSRRAHEFAALGDD